MYFQKFGERLGPLTRSIEDMNDHVATFRSTNVNVSSALLARVDDLNARLVVSSNLSIKSNIFFSYFETISLSNKTSPGPKGFLYILKFKLWLFHLFIYWTSVACFSIDGEPFRWRWTTDSRHSGDWHLAVRLPIIASFPLQWTTPGSVPPHLPKCLITSSESLLVITHKHSYLS